MLYWNFQLSLRTFPFKRQPHLKLAQTKERKGMCSFTNWLEPRCNLGSPQLSPTSSPISLLNPHFQVSPLPLRVSAFLCLPSGEGSKNGPWEVLCFSTVTLKCPGITSKNHLSSMGCIRTLWLTHPAPARSPGPGTGVFWSAGSAGTEPLTDSLLTKRGK